MILVTGAAGFIGSRLMHVLGPTGIALDKVPIVDMERFDTPYKICWDITDETKISDILRNLKALRIDGCVHLAAIAAPRIAAANPALAWDTNVRGTHNVLTLLRELGVPKVVFASSAHVYGISPRYMPTDENHPLALYDTYTTTKIAGEQLCQLFHANYGLSPTILRFFNGYGPGQSADYFIGVKLRQAREGGPLSLMNAEVTKDWVWVDDLVDGIVRAIETAFVGPINLGTGVETSLAGIASMIAIAFKTTIVPDAARDDSPTRMRCDWQRAKSILGWQPKIDIKTGIGRLIEDTIKS